MGPIAIRTADLQRNTLTKLKDKIFYFKNKKHLKRNVELKNKYQDKKCFILGCGPSIKDQDLSMLEVHLSLSVSNFFIHPDFKKIKPEFHAFAATHDPITDEQMVAWLKDAENYFPEG